MGIRLTWQLRPRSSRPSCPACAGESFTPASSTYSTDTRRPVAATCARAASTIAPSEADGTGTRSRRSASSAACRLTARLTCGWSAARRRMPAGRPTVETVMRRGLMPKPSAAVSRDSAAWVAA